MRRKEYHIETALPGIRDKSAKIGILVDWDGLPNKHDLHLKLTQTLAPYCLGMLESYLPTGGQRNLKRRALAKREKSD